MNRNRENNGNCALVGVNAALTAIKRVIRIYHSGPGLLYAYDGGRGESGERKASVLRAIYLDSVREYETERGVVLVEVDKPDRHVAAALETLDADALFILTGCTAGIIGDDTESVAKKTPRAGA
jgi:nitrogenase molybdenum-iron protein beta chain